jgi:DNA modification methylase
MKKINNNNLIVNPELSKLIQTLTSDEYQNLEKSIIDEGCRDAIILWNNTIVDGHNRYEICTKHNIAFNTIQKDFENIEFAKEWIIINQFSRRNINPYQRSILAIKLEKIITERKKENLKSGGHGKKGTQISAEVKGETRDEIAQIAGVSHFTIDSVKKIEASANEEVKANVKSGKIKVNQALQLIDKEADEEIKEKLNSGEISTKEAVKEIKGKKKRKQLEKKKEIYIEQAKKVMVDAPEVSLMDANDFLNTFKDNSIDLLFTDPPYSTDIPNIGEFTEKWLTLAIQKTKQTGRMLVFSGSYPKEIQAFLDVLLNQDKFIVDNPLIWTYKNTLAKTPKMKYNLNYQMIWHLYSDKSAPLDTSITSEMFSVQEDNAPDGRQGNRLHTWQKSDDLSMRLIRHASKSGKLVVDCFTCTGTFIIAANTLGRIGKGCDIDQANLDIAIKRGCKLINNSDVAPSTDNNATIYADQFQDELPSNEHNKTCNSDEYLDIVAPDDLLKIAKDVEEVDKNLSTDQITENTALEAQPSNVGFKKHMEKNRNLHKVNRREIKKMFQAKN